MARRYRYAIIKKKEPGKGKLSVGLAIASLLLFVAAVAVAYIAQEKFGFIVGGLCLFAVLLSAYGFVMGLMSFSDEECMHRTSVVGSILNGVIHSRMAGLFFDGSIRDGYGTFTETDGFYR